MSEVSNSNRSHRRFKERSQLTSLSVYVIVGLVVTMLLITLKLYVEGTQIGHRVEVIAYEFLHGQVSPFSRDVETPVVVLDIAQVPGGKGNEITSRAALTEILKELVDQKPRGIAVDVDFSPDSGGWKDKNDPAFFQFCLQAQKQGVPIFLGVYRTALQPADAWLGDAEFKTLAADMTIDASDTSRMRLWVQDRGNDRLLSISSALMKSQNVPLKSPPQWLRFALQDRVQVKETGSVELASVLVNYSKLEALESQSLAAISRQSIRDLGQRFNNKFVIVGDATDATDTFVVPSRVMPTPGVYLHACNVYTLAVEPFFELKHSLRLMIDLGLALIILLTVAIMRWKRRNQRFDWRRAQQKFIWRSVVVSIIAGVIAVRLLDILWLDFLLVVFILVLHPSVEAMISKRLHLPEEQTT